MIVAIMIYDEAFNYIGQIDDYEYLRWTRRWRKPHVWELQVNRYKLHADKLGVGRWIVVKRGGEFRGGRIEHMELALGEEGKVSEAWQLSGQCLGGLFHHRLALHATSTGNGYDEIEAPAETAMRHFIEVNAITPADVKRVVPSLVLEPDLGRGGLVHVRARFQPLTQVLEEISLASGLGWDTSLNLTSGQFEFRVLEGRNLTLSQTVHPPVIFSPEFDNVRMIGYRHSVAETKNVAYVAGEGQAESRVVVEVDSAAYAGMERRELFVDGRDLTTYEQLVQKGQTRLAEYGAERVMEVEYAPRGPFHYMADFDLGDIVHARYPGIGSMDARIVEVIEELSEEGEQYRMVLGKEWPDLVQVLLKDRHNADAEVRR